MPRLKKGTALSVAAALLLWQAAAMLTRQPLLLPAPLQVLARLPSLCMEEGFFAAVSGSFARIALGFLLGLLSGVALGAAAARRPLLGQIIQPYVLLMKSVPVASFVILALLWLSSDRLSVLVSFLMVFPVLYLNTLQGLRAADAKAAQMARLFKVPLLRRARMLYLPQLKPYLASACSAALGMAWKAGVAAEVIGVPEGSIGARLYEAKIYLDTPGLFAWTAVIVLMSLVFEKSFLWGLKKLMGGGAA